MTRPAHSSDNPARREGKASLIEAVLRSWQSALPDADLTSVSVSITVSRLAALFNRGAEDLARQFGFGYGELEVLFYLLSAGKPYELRPSDLLRGSFVTSGAITGRVDRLAKLGLVTRIASLIDRRELVVRLTSAGAKLARRLQTVVAFESALTTALQDLPEDRRTALDGDLRLILMRVEGLIERNTEQSAPKPRKRGQIAFKS